MDNKIRGQAIRFMISFLLEEKAKMKYTHKTNRGDKRVYAK
jgi:hypothetical protein